VHPRPLQSFTAATAVAALFGFLPAATAAQQPTPDPMADHEMASMPGMAPMLMRTREGSGTSWLPDVSPMAAIHGSLGGWSLMLHGNAFLQYIHEGGVRGDDQLGSINWAMGMARRTVGGGQLGLRTMLSADPFTISGCGYPVLLASGETCGGERLHDIQHQHDLFMELAAEYERPLGGSVHMQLYGGPVGEPALGPSAFPHRPSAIPNPIAPIGHHWFDGSHVSFGVATAALFGERWKVEGSLFNGREPDEHRKDLDLGALDSFSGRVTWLPSDRLSVQVSAGQLNEAEPGHSPSDARMDMKRYTGSATYHRKLGGGGYWATTAAAGRNIEEGESTNAMLMESAVSFSDRHLFFGRIEWAEKLGHELGLEEASLSDRQFDLAAVAAGYTLQVAPVAGWQPGIGARGSLSFVPAGLEAAYGGRANVGFTVFLSLRPAQNDMSMAGMMMGGTSASPSGSGARR
jgi:hypothetical protein